jgi:Flp pilus assembly protein TadB
MDDKSLPQEMGSLWRDQPIEPMTVLPEHFLKLRTANLSSATRAEILYSLGAAVFFMAVLAWRLRSTSDTVLLVGFLLLVVWILLTLYLVRKELWVNRDTDSSDISAASLEYYRKVLQKRRKHLASAWIWHGPFALSSLLLAVLMIRNAVLSLRRLESMLPLLLLLLLWIVIGIRQRRRQIREIQREMDEISMLARSR